MLTYKAKESSVYIAIVNMLLQDGRNDQTKNLKNENRKLEKH